MAKGKSYKSGGSSEDRLNYLQAQQAGLDKTASNYQERYNALNKSIKTVTDNIEKQNQMFLNMTDQMQGNMLKMDENIKVIAMQTSATLTHTEAPKLDVRKTSPVTRRRENGTAGASDAGTLW